MLNPKCNTYTHLQTLVLFHNSYFLKVHLGQQTNIPITKAMGKSIAGTNMFAVKIAGTIIGQDQYSNNATMRELAM